MTTQNKPQLKTTAKDGIITVKGVDITNFLPEGIDTTVVQSIDDARDAMMVCVTSAVIERATKDALIDYTVKPVSLGGRQSFDLAATNGNLTPKVTTVNSAAFNEVIKRADEQAAATLKAIAGADAEQAA